MKVVVGSPGTWGGLLLRIGQCAFAGASIRLMVSGLGFSSYTAYCYLIASMGVQALWSLGLACLDIFALKFKRDLLNPLLVSLFMIGDWRQVIFPNPGNSNFVACSGMLLSSCDGSVFKGYKFLHNNSSIFM